MNMIFLFNITCYSFTGIESIHQSLISAIPQFGSPNTPFHISPFHSFQSTFTFIHISLFYYHLFIPIQYYWIQSREYHSHHSLLISFISYFHLYLHSHIISILFISHNSCQSLSHSLPITSICYHFINSHPFISSSLIVSYDCCWL